MKKENLHDGHRDRVKERFLREGLDGFDDHNVLELMLFFSIPLKDTNEIAHRLINTFGSLDRVLDAPVDSLSAVKGVGPNTAVMLKLFPAVSRYYELLKHKPTARLSRGDELADYARMQNRFRTTENFAVIALDSDNHFVDYVDVSQGSTNMTEINLRKMVDTLLRTKAACAIIVHNHPSGSLKPSFDDLNTTRRLRDAMHLIGLTVLDHLIVNDDSYYSMRADSSYQDYFD